MEKFWVCWVIRTPAEPYKHRSLQSAQTEAERLARLTGKGVYIFECTGYCQVEQNPIKWEVPDDMV